LKLTTEIFESEGKHNARNTIRIVAKAATKLDVRKIVVFASSAQNVLALRKAASPDCGILAVTFPAGLTAMTDDMEPIMMGMPSRVDRRELREAGIHVHQGVMPLRALGENISPIIDAMQRVFSLLGGGTELCVQAVLMATDAGYLTEGERCIVMSADTALVMRAGNAFRFLKPNSRAAIEHILCKPLEYQISRRAANPPEKSVQQITEATESVKGLGSVEIDQE
jgi:hypothetical protein